MRGVVGREGGGRWMTAAVVKEGGGRELRDVVAREGVERCSGEGGG